MSWTQAGMSDASLLPSIQPDEPGGHAKLKT
jgi:hypothetical protein